MHNLGCNTLRILYTICNVNWFKSNLQKMQALWSTDVYHTIYIMYIKDILYRCVVFRIYMNCNHIPKVILLLFVWKSKVSNLYANQTWVFEMYKSQHLSSPICLLYIAVLKSLFVYPPTDASYMPLLNPQSKLSHKASEQRAPKVRSSKLVMLATHSSTKRLTLFHDFWPLSGIL